MDEKIQNFINHTKPIIDIFNEQERINSVNASIQMLLMFIMKLKLFLKIKNV